MENKKATILIHPDSVFRIIWEVYTLLVALAATLVTPLIIVFRIPVSPLYAGFDFLVTVTFLVDIWVHFNSSYFLKHELITNRKMIAGRYIKTWFILDLIATIPLLWMFNVGRFGAGNRLFRFMRLVRLVKLFSTTKTLRRARNISFVNPAILRLFVLVFWIFIAAHLIACGWIYIGGYENDPENDFSSISTIYLKAFYWTVTTLTTIGYGDITPSEPTQYVYVIFIMLIGAAIYGFIIGSMANIIANIDIAKAHFREQMQNINIFLKFRNIPLDLQKRIRSYYSYLWETRRGYEESSMLSDLPPSLRTEVSLFLNREMIKRVPLFRNASSSLVKEIILNLKPVVYTPGDRVVGHGEVGCEMFFISSGSLNVTNRDGSIIYATLSAGQFFGETALVLQGNRTATVTAMDYCDLYVLEKETFDTILRRYPRFAEIVSKLSRQRQSENYMIQEEADKKEEITREAPIPAMPMTPSYRVVGNNVIWLSWSASPHADRYELIRRGAGERNWKRLSGSLLKPEFTDTNVPGREASYRLRGINHNGLGEWSPILRIRTV